MISNPGVCPSEGFTLFGASTHRFQDELIGEFGSGNKMAINLLMRNRLFPVVFCGNLKLEFGLKKINMSETNFNQVTVKYSGRTEDGNTKNTTRDLDHVVDYGVKDWNAIELALREFISNALDSARSINNYEFWNKIEVKIVQDNQVRA
jgi:hypothetical protein